MGRKCLSAADWKLVNSSNAEALHLSMLSAHLLDQMLSQLAPQYPHATPDNASSRLSAYLPTPASPAPRTQPPHFEAPFMSDEASEDSGIVDESSDQASLEALLRCVVRHEAPLTRAAFLRLRNTLLQASRLAERMAKQPVRACQSVTHIRMVQARNCS
jgi:hypothetical protein